MVVGAKVCDLTEDLLWLVCGLYVGILTSPLIISSVTFDDVPYLLESHSGMFFSWGWKG